MNVKFMTCKQLLKMEHPEYVNDFFTGGCCGCPMQYKYANLPGWCEKYDMPKSCARCWDRLLAVPFKEDGTIVKEKITVLESTPPDVLKHLTHPVTQMESRTEMDISSMHPVLPLLQSYSDRLTNRQKKLYTPTTIRPAPVYTFNIQAPTLSPDGFYKEVEEMIKKDCRRYLIQDAFFTANVVAPPLRESLAKRKENTMKRNNKNEIKKVIFNDPATIVFWRDGSKTVVKAANEAFDHEKGLAMAIAKKHFGNEGNYYDIFKKWLPKKEETKEVAKGDGSLASVVKAFDDPMEEVRRLSNGSDEEAK